MCSSDLTATKTFFYFVRSTRQVVALTSRSHTQNQFLAMAEEADWLLYGRIRLIHGSIDWSALAESLMAHCRDESIYDPSLTRGRGAWRDEKAIVYHAGYALHVNGKRTQFEAFTKTKYRYLGTLKTTHPARDAATTEDCESLLSFIDTWGWEWPVLAPKIILGWIGCALICGALKWRPHLWITGTKGSGKSTLARVITGLLPPIDGNIVFDGQELPAKFSDRDKEMLRRVQMIYQMPDVALNPRQKIKVILGRPLEFYFGMRGEEKRQRVAQLMDQIELPERYVNRFPSELSGGEKQRVCIAKALAAEPDLIICDEVTSALDQLVADDILTLLQRLQNELGVSYLFITHDLATVKAISDEIVVMLQGRVVEHGTRDEVLAPPHHEYTELLLASVPEMDPDWRSEEHTSELQSQAYLVCRLLLEKKKKQTNTHSASRQT